MLSHYITQNLNAKLLRAGAKPNEITEGVVEESANTPSASPSEEGEIVPDPEFFDDAWRSVPKPDGEMPPPEDGSEQPPHDISKKLAEKKVNEEMLAIATDTGTSSGCNVKYKHWIGDGYCDKSGGYNTFECGYDGGDCCKDTCPPGQTYNCGHNGYDCKGVKMDGKR